MKCGIGRQLLPFAAGLIILLCIGCSGPDAATETENTEVTADEQEPGNAKEPEKENSSSLTGKPDAADTVSSITVDEKGYHPSDKKKAYFEGSFLTGSFYVTDAKSMKRVLQGTLVRTGAETPEGKPVWTGDFSDLTKEGIYYIETPVLGQSARFEISSGIYEKALNETFDKWESAAEDFDKERGADEDAFCENAQALLILLETMKMDRDMPDLRKDKVRRHVDSMKEKYEDKDLSLKESCLYITVMCNMAANLSEEDAESYRKAALEKWQSIDTGIPVSEEDETQEGQEDNLQEEQYYRSLASAALCMTEGELKYIQEPELYLKKLSGITGTDFQILFQYLCIPKISDVELCMDLMEKLIKTCTDICEDTFSAEDFFDEGKDSTDPEEKNKKALTRGMLLSLADNALVSREYRQGITDIYHVRSMEDPDWKDSLTQVQRAQLILLLSQADIIK